MLMALAAFGIGGALGLVVGGGLVYLWVWGALEGWW